MMGELHATLVDFKRLVKVKLRLIEALDDLL
jgi:hypothetical protein